MQPVHVLGATFNDPALVSVLLDAGKQDAREITVVHGFRSGIRDLSGLEVCVNLEEVDLHQNEISDVTALVGMQQLKVLHLGINLLTSAQPFASMPALEHLTLFQNDIEDITPLAQLRHLKALHLRYNLLEDIYPLGQLTTLQELSFGNNAVKDISAVERLTGLELLNGYFNFIEDLTPIMALQDLKWLYLGYNKITDIEPLFELENLLEVHLEGNEGIPPGDEAELQRFLADRRATRPVRAPPLEADAPLDEPDDFIQGPGDVPDRVKRQRAARAARKR